MTGFGTGDGAGLGSIPGMDRLSAVVPDANAAPQFHPSRSTHPIKGN
jgi:hypothetical protein